MSPRPHHRRKPLLWLAGCVALVASVVFLAKALDVSQIAAAWRSAVSSPVSVAFVCLIYGSAFAIRAWIWTRVLPGLGFGHALAALHVSLAGNHVLPLRLGEALRVTSVVRRAGIPLSSAAASTIVLRAADVLAVVTLAGIFGPALVRDLVGPLAWLVPLGAIGLWAGGLVWLKRLNRGRDTQLKVSTPLIASTAVLAWLLESSVMWQAARWAGLEISIADAILVTAVTIAAQTLAIAPGGIGTYEAAATASLVALGAAAGPALAAAIGAHALKTLYSLVTGAIALLIPSPSALGRLRLGHKPVRRDGEPVTERPERGPIVLFMPAHNEEEVIGDVVARVPAEVHGLPVITLVIDDGSHDRTAERAALAGAKVISMERNKGLGAAVRRGLSEAVVMDATAVAFCDADGEYAPEELGEMVRPILDGTADYVVGTRLKGNIERMLPHRRAGNLVLTALLRYIARHPISDGQSGYRAFSPEAAAEAEVIHDFNYAQVITLDLLDKGFRYVEIPISYSFRTTGHSFVRLGRYLRKVIPAIHRELNQSPAATGRRQSSTM